MPQHQRGLQHKCYNTRVALGKCEEERIIKLLVAKGFKVEASSRDEDMFDKVDAWLIKGDARIGLQIKRRFTNADIPIEALHFFYYSGEAKKLFVDMPLDGRDMKGKASLYVCLTKDNTLWMCSKQELCKIAEASVRKLLGLHLRSPSIKKVEVGCATAQIVEDPSTKRHKVIVWIKPQGLVSSRVI